MDNKKLKSQSGFSMVEILCVIVILTLLTGVIGTGIALCSKTFASTVTRSESSMLTASIDSMITDELRYASNINVDSNNKLISYSSTMRGLRNVSIIIFPDSEATSSDDYRLGKVFLRQTIGSGASATHKDTLLLGTGSYVENCKARNLNIVYNGTDGIFTVSYELVYKNPQKPEEERIENECFQVKTLKN